MGNRIKTYMDQSKSVSGNFMQLSDPTSFRGFIHNSTSTMARMKDMRKIDPAEMILLVMVDMILANVTPCQWGNNPFAFLNISFALLLSLSSLCYAHCLPLFIVCVLDIQMCCCCPLRALPECLLGLTLTCTPWCSSKICSLSSVYSISPASNPLMWLLFIVHECKWHTRRLRHSRGVGGGSTIRGGESTGLLME